MTKAVVEGGEELLEKLDKMGVDVSRVLEVAAQAGADVFVNLANPLAPDSLIDQDTVERKRNRVEVDVGPPDEKWYWRFLETGATRHEITGNPLAFVIDGELIVIGGVDHPGMPARPFMRPAFDQGKGRATDAVGDRIRKVVEP